MTVIAGFEYLWNGTEPGWVVLRTVEDRQQLTAIFDGGADVQALKALRAILPSLAAAPMIEVFTLRGITELDLGEYESSEARRLKSQCAGHGVSVISRGWQVVSYQFFNESTRMCLLMEDPFECDAMALEAIKRGVPVRHIEF